VTFCIWKAFWRAILQLAGRMSIRLYLIAVKGLTYASGRSLIGLGDVYIRRWSEKTSFERKKFKISLRLGVDFGGRIW